MTRGRVVVLVACVVASAACGGGGGNVTGPVGGPVSLVFEARNTTLMWETDGCVRRTIDRGIGDVPPVGSREVSITQPTTYWFTCIVKGGRTHVKGATASLCYESLTAPPCAENALDDKLHRWTEQYANQELPKLDLSGRYDYTLSYSSRWRELAILQYYAGTLESPNRSDFSPWVTSREEIMSKAAYFGRIRETILMLDTQTY